MDPGQLFRTARRHAGLSQRALAAASGVSRSTIEDVEAGRRTPSWKVVQAVLDAADLEVTVEPSALPVCRHVRAHLRLSLAARLHLVLGGSGRPRVPPAPPGWQDLDVLAAHGMVQLTGRSALGLWLPGLAPTADSGASQVHWTPFECARAVPATVLDVRRVGRVSHATVTVPLPVRSLRTPPPGALAMHPDCAPFRRALRSVARVLDEEAATDPASRRAPAHLEPRREEEAWRLLFARRWSARLGAPGRLDGRGWRLDDEVGMREWIERRARRP